MKMNYLPLENERILSMDEVIHGFERFENYVKSNTNLDLSYDEIKKVYRNNMNFHPIVFLSDCSNMNFVIFRARCFKQGEDINDITNYTYPRADICYSRGRANIKKYPTFYGSLDIITTFEESRVKENDKIYVGKWRVKPNAKIWAIQMLYSDKSLLQGVVAQHNKDLTDKLREISKPYSNDKTESIEYLVKRIGEYFVNDDNYYLSSFFAHYFLYDFPKGFQIKPSLLVYPSIAGDRSSINFAIHPDFVDENMELVEIYEYTFRGVVTNPTRAKISMSKMGIIENRKINWKNTCVSKDFKVAIKGFWCAEPFPERFEEARFHYNNTNFTPKQFVHQVIQNDFQSFLDLLCAFDGEIILNEKQIKTLNIKMGDNELQCITSDRSLNIEVISIEVEYELILE
ncbi:MAG: hypothetical protein ACKVOU_04275 [Cytophagales bacterium]